MSYSPCPVAKQMILSRPRTARRRERDLLLVGRHHFDPPIAGAHHGGIVDLHPHPVGERRALVGIDSTHAELGLPRQEAQHRRGLAGAGPASGRNRRQPAASGGARSAAPRPTG